MDENDPHTQSHTQSHTHSHTQCSLQLYNVQSGGDSTNCWQAARVAFFTY